MGQPTKTGERGSPIYASPTADYFFIDNKKYIYHCYVLT